MGNWCLVIGQAKGKNSFYSLLTHYNYPFLIFPITLNHLLKCCERLQANHSSTIALLVGHPQKNRICPFWVAGKSRRGINIDRGAINT